MFGDVRKYSNFISLVGNKMLKFYYHKIKQNILSKYVFTVNEVRKAILTLLSEQC